MIALTQIANTEIFGFIFVLVFQLLSRKVLFINKTLTQITNTEIFGFIFALVFQLLSRKVLFINRKDNRNC